MPVGEIWGAHSKLAKRSRKKCMRGLIYLDSRGQRTLGKMPEKHNDVWVVTNIIRTPCYHHSLLRVMCSAPKARTQIWLLTSNSVLPKQWVWLSGLFLASEVNTLPSHFPWRHAEDFQSQKILMTDRISILFCMYMGICFSLHRGL